jgi:hypothetical protein
MQASELELPGTSLGLFQAITYKNELLTAPRCSAARPIAAAGNIRGNIPGVLVSA